jgi:hypothetical protein
MARDARGERASRAARLTWAVAVALGAGLFVVLVTLPAALGALVQSVQMSMTAPSVTRPTSPPAAVPVDPERPADRAINPAEGDLGSTQLIPSTALTADTAAATSGVYALIIGINDYPGTDHDLRSAVADADVMARSLGRFNVPRSNIIELVDGQATSAAIANGISWLVGSAGPDSTAVFFYSGHARKLASTTEAIVGSDGVAITDVSLASMFAPLQARDAWFVIAACYGGGFDELVQPGRILTAAADSNSLAWENDSFGLSYLGEYLVRRGLLQGGAGGATVQQAFAWAQASIQREAPNRPLTELDAATGPISLDGVARTTVPPIGPVPSAPAPTPSAPAPPSPAISPPSTVPPRSPTPVAPRPCQNLLRLGCPSN